MIIKSDKANIKSFPGTTIREYGDGGTGTIDVGVATLTASYPGGDKFARNIIVEVMTYYVVNGSCRFQFDGDEPKEINTGDLVLIPRGMGYRVIDPENLEVVMVSTPPWTVDQYEIYVNNH